jgi:hypothetical protein
MAFVKETQYQEANPKPKLNKASPERKEAAAAGKDLLAAVEEGNRLTANIVSQLDVLIDAVRKTNQST